MQLICPACGTATVVADDRLPPEGARARCHACSGVSVYYRGGLVADDPTPPHGTAVPPHGTAAPPHGAMLPHESAVLPHESAAVPQGEREFDAADAADDDLTPPQGMLAQQAHEQHDAGGPAHRLAALPTIALAVRAPLQREEPAPVVAAGPAPSIGWQLRTAAGDQGPYPLDALRPMVRDGRLQADDLACPPGGAEWLRAGDLPDLQRWFALRAKTAPAAAPGASDMAPCSRHPGVRGRWMCQGCGHLACDGCVITAEVARVVVHQCPACRKSCTELVPTKKITPFWQDVPALLTYPVRGLGWLALIIFPLMGIGAVLSRAAAMAMSLAWGAAAFFTLSIYAYHLWVIRTTNEGGRSMPNLGKVENYQDDFVKPAAKAALVSFLLFLPAGWTAGGVRDARAQVGLAQGLRDSIAADEKEAARLAADPDAERERPVFDEDSLQGAMDSAFASMGSEPDEEQMGQMIGQFAGAMDWREDRDFPAELREADGAIADARSRLRGRLAIHAIVVGLALFIWPIFLIIVALFNTIVPVFQPQVLLKLIREIPVEYAWCTAFTSACFLAIFLCNLPMRGNMIFSSWLTSPLTYYFSLIAFHVMGRTAELAEQKVDWH